MTRPAGRQGGKEGPLGETVGNREGGAGGREEVPLNGMREWAMQEDKEGEPCLV